MIVDTFLFFNELELLEIRCEELKGKVDYHILIESPMTFQGNDKPLYFKKSRNYFRDYPIIPVAVDLPFVIDVTREQAFQNEATARDEGFKVAADLLDAEDIVLLSDVDEIPRASKIQDYGHPVTYLQKQHYYWLNFQSPEIWKGTVQTNAGLLKLYGGEKSFQARRDMYGSGVISDGGWHFSYQGGVKRIQQKIKSFSHVEFNNDHFLDKDRIEVKLQTGSDLFDRDGGYQKVDLDETYPNYLMENQKHFRHLIWPGV